MSRWRDYARARDLAGGVTVLARIVVGLLLVGYLLFWLTMLPFLLMMWDEANTWLSVLLVWVNPLTLFVGGWLVTRAIRGTRHG